MHQQLFKSPLKEQLTQTTKSRRTFPGQLFNPSFGWLTLQEDVPGIIEWSWPQDPIILGNHSICLERRSIRFTDAVFRKYGPKRRNRFWIFFQQKSRRNFESFSRSLRLFGQSERSLLSCPKTIGVSEDREGSNSTWEVRFPVFPAFTRSVLLDTDLTPVS